MFNYVKKLVKIGKSVFGEYDEFKVVYDGDYPSLVIKYRLESPENNYAVNKFVEILESAEFAEYDVFTELDTDYSEIGVMPGSNFKFPDKNYFETEYYWGEADYDSIAE